MYGPNPPSLRVGELHGLVSGTEWTGVSLRMLLEEAGADPAASWLLAEGADAAAMSRSVPMAKAMDDALIALYQNGERLRPENGYPVRLFLPGYERQYEREVASAHQGHLDPDHDQGRDIPLHGPPDRREIPHVYLPDGGQVCHHSALPGGGAEGPGLYEVSGIAWSGSGTITKVEVSADGGQTWADAALSAPVLPRALTRFRIAWKWSGGPAIVKSRATDSTGEVQPTRDKLVAEHGTNVVFHYNAIQAWSIAPNGEVKNVYA